MPNTYVIRIKEKDSDPNVIELVTLNKKLYSSTSLSDACDARDNAAKWVKGEYTICVLQELTNV